MVMVNVDKRGPLVTARGPLA